MVSLVRVTMWSGAANTQMAGLGTLNRRTLGEKPKMERVRVYKLVVYEKTRGEIFFGEKNDKMCTRIWVWG